jgi:hypothetical protein
MTIDIDVNDYNGGPHWLTTKIHACVDTTECPFALN